MWANLLSIVLIYLIFSPLILWLGWTGRYPKRQFMFGAAMTALCGISILLFHRYISGLPWRDALLELLKYVPMAATAIFIIILNFEKHPPHNK